MNNTIDLTQEDAPDMAHEAVEERDQVIDLIDNGDEGNTNSSSPRQVRRWVFTLHIDNVAEVDAILVRMNVAQRYVCQVERTPTTQRLHIQGYMEFKNGRTLSGLKRILERAHFEAAKGDATENYNYCTKEDTRVLGPFYKGFAAIPILPITEFRPWQRKVWALYNSEPDDRSIYWFYDLHGGVGKTAMAKYLCIKGKCVYVNGKASDVKYAVCKVREAGIDVKCVIWGIPRQSQEYVSYAAIEEVKDGLFFSSKYESGTVVMNSPHIFVFCNFYPETHKLSQDRWRIFDITSGELPDEL